MLDEPTSALDPHSEPLIQESLTALKHELTLFIDRPPHVHARHLRPRDGDRRRPPGGVRHHGAPAGSTTTTTAPPRCSPPSAPGSGCWRCGEGGCGYERRDGGHGGPPERCVVSDQRARTLARDAAAARLLHRRPAQERHHGAVRDAAPPPADLHARRQGAVVLRERAARAHAAAPGRDAARRSSEYLALFAAAGPEQRVGEASRAVSVVAHRRASGSPRSRPPRGSSRSCASPRACCARCTCSSWRPTSRPRPTCARRSRSSAPRREGRAGPPPHLLAAGAAVLRARALRRAAAPLPRAVRRASRCWC